MGFGFGSHQFAKLHVSFSPTFLGRPLTESTELDTAVFLVKGISIGQTTVSAIVVDKDKTEVTSAPQQIEV